MSKTKLPSVVTGGVKEPATRRVLDQVKEMLDVWAGRRGNELDRVLTARDFTQGDFANLIQRGGGLHPDVGNTIGGGRQEHVGALQDLTATGAMENIILAWAGTNQRGYAHTEIWRAAVDDLGQAELVGTSVPPVYADTVGPDAERFYWVRAVSTTGQPGPYNATAGTRGQTAVSPEYLLEVLTGEITESQLYQGLSTRIDLIDAPASVAGSVAQQIATEAHERSTAIEKVEAVLDNPTTGLSSKASRTELTDAIAGESQARSLALEVIEAVIDDPTTGLASKASVVALNEAVAGEAKARGTAIQQVNAKIDHKDTGLPAAFAAVETVSEAVVNLDDKTAPAVAQWSVKATVNDLTGGIGLFNDGEEVAVGVHASRFYVADPTAPEGAFMPFVVDNGRVIINQAAIADASITSAKIKSLAVDKLTTNQATIAEAIIGTGHITNAMIGQTIMSDDYQAGSRGWIIRKSGTAEFSNGIFRGDVHSENAYVRGNVEATSLKVNSANIVDTLHLRGQAVTVPVHAYSSGTIGLSGSWQNIITAAITTSGAPVLILPTCKYTVTSAYDNGRSAFFRILRNGSVIYGPVRIGNTYGEGSVTFRTVVPSTGIFSLTFRDTPPQGSHVYTVQAYRNSDSGSVEYPAIFLLETKR